MHQISNGLKVSMATIPSMVFASSIDSKSYWSQSHQWSKGISSLKVNNNLPALMVLRFSIVSKSSLVFKGVKVSMVSRFSIVSRFWCQCLSCLKWSQGLLWFLKT